MLRRAVGVDVTVKSPPPGQEVSNKLDTRCTHTNTQLHHALLVHTTRQNPSPLPHRPIRTHKGIRHILWSGKQPFTPNHHTLAHTGAGNLTCLSVARTKVRPDNNGLGHWPNKKCAGLVERVAEPENDMQNESTTMCGCFAVAHLQLEGLQWTSFRPARCQLHIHKCRRQQG